MCIMKYKFVRKYFGIILLLASFMGSFHHHHDALNHADCQICTIASSIADADTPTEALYLTKLVLQSDATLSQLQNSIVSAAQNHYKSRAPPSIIL